MKLDDNEVDIRELGREDQSRERCLRRVLETERLYADEIFAAVWANGSIRDERKLACP